MRIIHVIASLDPEQGGPPVVAESLAWAQEQLGHDVLLAAEIFAKGRASRVELPKHGGGDLFRAPKLEVLKFLKDADVVHMHCVWEPILPAVAKAARNLNRPYVITPHGMLDPWSLTQKKWKKKLALALGYRRMLDGASALHLLNDDEKKLLAPLGLNAPCEVIPNGIFLDELDPPPDPNLFRSRQSGLNDRPYILFLSRLHYKKGLDLLADAFAGIAAKYPQIGLVVAGPDGGEEHPFRKRIEGLGLTQRTRITGPLYGAEKWSVLAGAIVFCLPSRQEGFSVAILEAMACGKPVVISENCHFPEVAEVAAGRIVPLQANAVENALSDVLSDTAAAILMGQAGRRLVEKRFTWPKVAAQTIALYERLLNSVPAR
jgi:glycosyltransferase involved in cell wall biosynthesis